MGRRIWIIPKTTKVTQEVRTEAEANNCPEIVIGVPPILKKELHFQKLPLVYEEPEPPSVEPTRDILKELDELAEKVAALEEK